MDRMPSRTREYDVGSAKDARFRIGRSKQHDHGQSEGCRHVGWSAVVSNEERRRGEQRLDLF